MCLPDRVCVEVYSSISVYHLKPWFLHEMVTENYVRMGGVISVILSVKGI